MSSKEVLILTGESSGELYGALLAKELLRRWPDLEIYGIGGERMEASGVRLLGRIGHAFGLIEAIGAIKNIRKNFSRVVEYLKKRRPQVVVLIDYPDFNIRVGEIAKRLGIKVLYYVSPQVWAWRKKRKYRIRDLADRIAVVLPFEEEIYRSIGADVEFVGHPVTEELEGIEGLSRHEVREFLNIPEGSPVFTLLPGSRPSEVRRLLPLMEEVAEELTDFEIKGGVKPELLMPLAPNLSLNLKDLNRFEKLGVRVLPPFLNQWPTVTSSLISLKASDMAIAASGTVVFQAGLLGVPTIVVYRLSKLTYHIARLVVDVRYISIPNIILGREVFPELIQDKARLELVMDNIKRLMSEEMREEVMGYLRRLREVFSNKRPSERVATMIEEITGW
jgi:lipid-A-disaccharide synthase